MDTDTKEYYERFTMTHAEQVNKFGWCVGEDGEGHICKGCPQEAK